MKQLVTDPNAAGHPRIVPRPARSPLRSLSLAAVTSFLCASVWACDGGDVSLGSDALGGQSRGEGQPADPGGDSGAPPSDAGRANTEPGDPGDAARPSPGDGSGDTGTPGNTDPVPGTGAGCGSRGLPPCPDGEFCNHPIRAACGATDIPGVCEVRPGACRAEVEPVCGCDGQTYENACSAARAGVSVGAEGECGGTTEDPPPGVGEVCGGIAGFACPNDRLYCDYAQGDGCGVADGQGVCTARPSACTRELLQVCGCDEVTYANPCEAAAAGASIAGRAACPPVASGDVCGGFIGAPCPRGEYCDHAQGDGCDIADGQGRCAIIPDLCTDDVDPICGCDNVEYSNACSAAAAMMSVRNRGACSR